MFCGYFHSLPIFPIRSITKVIAIFMIIFTSIVNTFYRLLVLFFKSYDLLDIL